MPSKMLSIINPSPDILVEIHSEWEDSISGCAHRSSKIDIKGEEIDVSDGHHTMSELYEHRNALFCALIKNISYGAPSANAFSTWKSRLHYDGTMYEGWFIAGILGNQGQISYHLPIEWWDKCIAREVARAPEYNGYTSKDAIERLLKI